MRGAERRQARAVALRTSTASSTRRQELGAKGLVWAVVEDDGWRSPVAKFLSDEEIVAANEALEASEGDVLLIVADAPATSAAVLGELRRRLGERLGPDRPRAPTR